jgi:multicomponent K+:H+ antiporter subunit D
MLLVVFAIKAAALPLYFWLPSTYGAASAPVASLFAIMTKVGLYAIVRVSTLVLGPDAGPLAGLGQSLVLWGGVATAVAAALGVLSSRDLRAMAAYLVIASVGLLMIAFGLGTTEGLAAGVYYLVHSTIVMAGFFLLAENLGSRRGPLDTALTSGPAFPGLGVVGVMYFAYAIAAVGLPPLSGFVGKFFVLRAAVATPWAAELFVVILGAGLLALIAAGRAGTVLFWRTSDASESHTLSAKRSPLAPALIHLAIAVALVAAAGPALRFATGVASQLVDASGYIDAVMSHVSIGRS